MANEKWLGTAGDTRRVLVETGLFIESSIYPNQYLRLTHTGYYIYIVFNPTMYDGSIWRKINSNNYTMEQVSFEEVLDSVPAEIQVKLLFHLELFR